MSTIYTSADSYQVIMEVAPEFKRDESDEHAMAHRLWDQAKAEAIRADIAQGVDQVRAALAGIGGQHVEPRAREGRDRVEGERRRR